MRRAPPRPRTEQPSAMQAQGQCICGAVRFEIDTPAVGAWHDHSEASRRAQGCAYVTDVGSWKSRFRVLEGADGLRRYEDAEAGTARSFCICLGAPVIYERDRSPRYMNIPRLVDRPHKARAALSRGYGGTARLDQSARTGLGVESLSRCDVGQAPSNVPSGYSWAAYLKASLSLAPTKRPEGS